MALEHDQKHVESAPTTNGPSVYLIDDVDAVDRGIIERWARDAGGAAAELLVVPHPRVIDTSERAAAFASRLQAGDDALLTPIRVTWLPKERDGQRAARLRDIVLGDPRHPPQWRKRRIVDSTSDRAQVIVGEPARLSELRGRFREEGSDPDDTLAFAGFVARQAVLARERAEYRVLGAQYKVPRIVRDEIVANPEFRAGAARLAAQLGRDESEVWAAIEKALDEMVTGYSRFFLDLMARLGQIMKRPGYGDEIDYDEQQLERVRHELRRHPAVILPSHKSNLDALVVPVALHENGLPPTHTFAGINMAFWPFGSIFRRAGRIFIRRDVRSDPVYRWVLREYLGYLVENRFTLEWYIEGTRSRTGKLGPPKMGLLRYIVDACREGRTDDVAMLPVSIVYDELHEVSEFSAEATGGVKKAEGLGWAVNFYRGQRRKFGKIYVRFGEPLSLRAAIEADTGDEQTGDELSIQLQKLAFEVSTRINAVTPITASSLICLVLLSTRGRALTEPEIHVAVRRLLEQIRARRLPLAASAATLDEVDGVRAVLGSLAANHTIEVYQGGSEPVYSVARGQQHSAAFYRNTIIHFFVEGAIAELALLAAADHEGDGGLDAFWDEAYRLRDVLKFDFFFEQRDAFRKALASELTGRLPDWEAQIVEGTDPGAMLDQLQPLHAFAVLRPFIEAYMIVARTLLMEPTDVDVDEKAVTKTCLALGEQWVRQEWIRSPEAVSRHLFASALQLAANRDLTKPGSDLHARRQTFVDELTDVARRIDIVEQRTYEASGKSLTTVHW